MNATDLFSTTSLQALPPFNSFVDIRALESPSWQFHFYRHRGNTVSLPRSQSSQADIMPGGGLTAPKKLSPELADIVGKKEASRAELMKLLWAYIKKNNLQVTSPLQICDFPHYLPFAA